MINWHNHSTDELCKALLSLKTEEEVYNFLDDVCTIREVLDIAQRFSVAKMLSEGESYSAIGKATGASTATISRVNKCYEYGAGGYRTVLHRLYGGKEKKADKKD